VQVSDTPQSGFQQETDRQTLTLIIHGTQTITFGALTGKTYGDLPFTVDATASSGLTVTFSVMGSCSNLGNTVTITGAGSCTITAHQPGDPIYFAASDVTQSFTIAKATPVITWSNPADITYPTPLGSTQLNATANVPGMFTYTPVAGTVLNAGPAQNLHVDFAPTDSNNYNSASMDVKINVLKGTSVITWSNPADITYPTPLGSTQLNATASVPGTFTYTPPAGTVLSAGPGQNLHVDFAPTNTNYNSTSKDVTINVLKATSVITWSNPADITYPTPLSATQLNAAANVPGTFTYTPPSGTVLNAGLGQNLHVDFAPTNTNYNGTSKDVKINVIAVTHGFSSTGSMLTARSFHTATFLPINGKVLVTGGFDSSGAPLASTELYDPVSKTWSSAGAMPNKAAGHTATLLSSGKVLVVGGGNSSSEIYDPASNTWTRGGGIGQRTYHTATLLAADATGKQLVLIAGGSGNNGATTNSALLYDPSTGNVTNTGNMTVSRDFHTATLLPNGKVLITGGRTGSGSGYAYLQTGELYDPATGTFTAISGSSMASARFGHTAILLPANAQGKQLVLLAGGGDTASSQTATADLYDPSAGPTGTFSSTAGESAARQYSTATLFGGAAVEVGGLNGTTRLASAEQYQGGSFVPAGTMKNARAAHTATPLIVNGVVNAVLITGGQGSNGVSIASAELLQ
jgi:hypothetical protein